MPIEPGIDVLIHDRLSLVAATRVGLVTNHSAVTRDLTHSVDALLAAGVEVAALFGPEHGIRGDAPDGKEIASGVDVRTGIPIRSLYGVTKKPTPEMLSDLDVVLFDIQDIGCRFYTYIWTMALVMEACAESGKRFIVLDRPNPVGGTIVEGNILEAEYRSFVGLYPVPIRHGLTVGEMALYLNGEIGRGTDVEVVPCRGWERGMWFGETGLPWVMPSPGMPTLDTATLYPGTCLIEGTNVSEGRGTCRPFEIIGAPWIDPHALAEYLDALHLPGVKFRPLHFVPWTSKHSGENCGGVQVHIIDRESVRSVLTGIHIVKACHDLYPGDFRLRDPASDGRSFFDLLAGTSRVRTAIQDHLSVDELVRSWYDELGVFLAATNRYWLYS